MRTVLFYVSGHGYGHAVRISEVMRALARIRPEWRILVRTQAPRDMFPDFAEVTASDCESGIVEREAGIVVDEEATKARLDALLDNWKTIVAREAAFARVENVDLIVADIPPIAGDIARAVGVPCVGISNFTWDWIYEPYQPRSLARIEDAYAKFSVLLQLPFSQTERLEPFARVIEAPLIARKSAKVFPLGDRKRVFLGSRAQVSPDTLERAAQDSPDFEFVTPQAGQNFTDILASCDLVLAKLGFSMVAESIAARKPILYPPRANFREELILQLELPRHLPALPIPINDFYSGIWRAHLQRLTVLPPVSSSLRTDGAEFCAEFICET